MTSRRVLSIVLVEDDHDDIEIFTEVLSSITTDVVLTTIEDGSIAFKLLRSGDFTPDILFLDLHLPNLDGLELLTAIRKENLLRDTRVVIHTSVDNPLIVSKCTEFGVTDILLKDPSNVNLADVLKGIVRQHKGN